MSNELNRQHRWSTLVFVALGLGILGGIGWLITQPNSRHQPSAPAAPATAEPARQVTDRNEPGATASRATSDETATGLSAVSAAMRGGDGSIDPYQLYVVKNPKGQGLIVYCPRIRLNCSGSQQYAWVVAENRAYAVNGPSKRVTPLAQWPREAQESVWNRTGLDRYNASSTLAIVFK